MKFSFRIIHTTRRDNTALGKIEKDVLGGLKQEEPDRAEEKPIWSHGTLPIWVVHDSKRVVDS